MQIYTEIYILYLHTTKHEQICQLWLSTVWGIYYYALYAKLIRTERQNF